MFYRRKSLILLIALLGLLSQGVIAQQPVHTVVSGDTIFSLARTYRVSQEDLMRRNNITDPSRLRVGMRLTIPTAASAQAAPAAATAAPGIYIVQPNDTLYSLARRWGVTLQALREFNGFSANHNLRIGERVRIPGTSSQAAPSGAIAAGNTRSQPASSQAPRSQTAPVQLTRSPAIRIDPAIRWPITAKEIVYMHNNMGVLISGQRSESVKSMSRGTVIHASLWRGYGKVAVIETTGGLRYLYGSFDTLSVRKGDTVMPGTELGKLGIYPASGRTELVFMVSRNGSFIDPVRAPRS